jgi:hypothetical protein
MASDETELMGLDSETPLNLGIGQPRRLVMFDAVRAEATLKETDNPSVFELTGLHLRQIVRQGK